MLASTPSAVDHHEDKRRADTADLFWERQYLYPGLIAQVVRRETTTRTTRVVFFMVKRKTGWPFLEGYLNDGKQEIHLFTDYRWNDGSVSRRWHVHPERFNIVLAVVRPISLKLPGREDQ